MIYVASSWSNPLHIAVCAALKSAKLEHYDFKAVDPTTGTAGFHWSEIGLVDNREVGLDPQEFLSKREHPRAYQGFVRDMAALHACHTCVLVLPCGRSAHLELGWAVGQGKRTAILLDDPCTPDLMYHMVDLVTDNLIDLLGWLGVTD